MVAKFKKIRKRKFRKGNLFWILLLIIFVGLIGVLIVANVRINKKRAEYIDRIETLKKEIQEVEEKSEELKKGVSQAGSKEHLEKVAREQLGLKNPGEEVVVITKEEEESSSSAEATEDKGSFWNPKKWWELIKGK